MIESVPLIIITFVKLKVGDTTVVCTCLKYGSDGVGGDVRISSMYFISVKEPLVTKKNLTVIPSRSPSPFLLSKCVGRLPRMSPVRLHFS